MIKIQKSYGECIRKNDKILKLISFILKNYLLLSTQGDHYQSIVNAITNTDFTIDDKTYRHLPKFKNNEERISFFKGFSVIKENNLYEQKEKKYEKMISLNTTSRITTLNICNDKKTFNFWKRKR